MKIKFTILLGITIALGACSSSAYLADDVYYSPKDEKRAAKNVEAVAATSAVAEAVPASQGFESATYVEPENGVSGVYNGDTLELETFEYENGDKELIVNNYYDDYYSDNTDYSSRISRFYGPSSGFGYYSPYYGPSFSFGMGIGMGFGFGMGFGYGYGGGYYGGYYPYYPYYRPYYNSCYYPCYPYYGYGGGYYGGYPGYVSDGSGYTSTHRRSPATGRAMDYSNGGTKSSSLYDNTASRRRGVSASAANTALKSRSAATAPAPGNRRNIESRSMPAADVRTTRTLPSRNNNLAQAQNRSANTVNTRTSQNTAKRIPAKTTTASNTSRNSIQEGNTTQKRYVPRYTTPKKTTIPSYNRSGAARSVNTTRPSSVTRQGYTSPTQSRSSFSSPSRTNARSTTTRSYNPGSSSSGRSFSSPSRSSSSGRSYSPSSSGSGSRSSGSSSGSRSSGSSSSSSSSGGRRR